jgi:hypothetical protein
MDQTPWIQRGLDIRQKGKEAGTQARKKALKIIDSFR